MDAGEGRRERATRGRASQRRTRPTLKDVAAEVGVSAQTVSNAFHRPDQLSPELRTAVLDAAARLRFSGPDPAARSLRSGRASALGVLYNAQLSFAFDDPAFVLFLRGLARTAEDAGLAMVLVPGDPTGAKSTHSTLGLAVIDGVVVYSVPNDDPLYSAAVGRGLPLVLVDSPQDGLHPFVGADDEAAGRQATEHVLELGHRRLAVISLEFGAQPHSGPADLQRQAAATNRLTQRRLAGSRTAADVAGIAWETVPVFETAANTEDDGRQAAHLLLGAAPRPTALLAMSDRLALGALAAAADLGIDVPASLSVTGIDDVPAAATAVPSLTTIAQDHDEKGRIAGRLLLASLESDDRAVSVPAMILPTRLEVRASTGPPPPDVSGT